MAHTVPLARLSAFDPVPNEPCGLAAEPNPSISNQMSSFCGRLLLPQMPSTVTVTREPAVSFQIAIGNASNGRAHLLLPVVTIFQLNGVVPSDAPPVRTMVVSTVCVPSYQYRSVR